MYWLALYLPALPLDAVADALPVFHHKAGPQHPLGILDGGRLTALSKEATTAGAHIGMTLAAASSLAPGLVAIPRQPHREAALLQRLALALSGSTPVIVVEPDGLRLELSSTLRLFGGRGALLRRLEAIVRDCGVEQLRVAQASTPAGASLLARVDDRQAVAPGSPKLPTPSIKSGERSELESTALASPKQRNTLSGERRERGDHPTSLRTGAGTKFSPPQRPAASSVLTQQRLDQLPIDTVLPLWSQPRALVELLQGIGCRTLRDLRALPRGGLTRRGGRQLMSLVARAYGDEPDPQVMYEPPPAFELGLELMQRADKAAALVFASQRLVQPLVGWLGLRWLAASRLLLKLRHEPSRRHELPDSILEISLAQPSRDAAHIMVLLRERLERMSLPAPVYAIVLRLDDAVSHAGRAGALWANSSSQRENERALIDRLSARLGSDRVQRVQLCSDHRPERAMRWLSAQDVSIFREQRQAHVEPDPVDTGGGPPANTVTAQPKPAGTPRPTWLLAEPLPLHDDGAGPFYKGKPLVIISRAERIEAGWFDDGLASRDYHIAVGDDVCCWIYRERRAEACADPSRSARWFLHGIFG